MSHQALCPFPRSLPHAPPAGHCVDLQRYGWEGRPLADSRGMTGPEQVPVSCPEQLRAALTNKSRAEVLGMGTDPAWLCPNPRQ